MMTVEEIEEWVLNNNEKLQQYAAWLDYQIGFSGMGTTALDIKPEFPIPTDIPEQVKSEMIITGKQWAFMKWQAWCKACEGIDDYAIEENWKCPNIG